MGAYILSIAVINCAVIGTRLPLLSRTSRGLLVANDSPPSASKAYSDFNPESDRHLSISRSSYHFMRHTVALVLGVAQPHPEDLIIGKLPRLLSNVPVLGAISKVLATAS